MTTQAAAVETGDALDLQIASILNSLAAEEIDMLRDAFICMDRDSDGYVGFEEMMTKVRECVGPERVGPLREYLTPLFAVADKDQDGRLNLTEFLSSYADGPGVVPAEVVNFCVASVRVRLSDEEIAALQDSFYRIDENGDGFIDPAELEKALREHLRDKFPDLTDAGYAEIVAVVIASADADRDGKLSLSEFIRSYQEDQGVLPATFAEPTESPTSPERAATAALAQEDEEVLRRAFATFDTDGDGYVAVGELYELLWDNLALSLDDGSQVRDLGELILKAAERGDVRYPSLEEFVYLFLQRAQQVQFDHEATQEQFINACAELQWMYERGELRRCLADGGAGEGAVVNVVEMTSVLQSLFALVFPTWEADALESVMSAAVVGTTVPEDLQISLAEFIEHYTNRTTAASIGLAVDYPRRRYSASDSDLSRIAEVFHKLNAETDADGCIDVARLRLALLEAFPATSFSAAKAEEMLQYVFDHFARNIHGGRVSWHDGASTAADAVASPATDHEEVVFTHDEDRETPSRAEGGTANTAKTSTPRQRPSVQAMTLEDDEKYDVLPAQACEEDHTALSRPHASPVASQHHYLSEAASQQAASPQQPTSIISPSDNHAALANVSAGEADQHCAAVDGAVAASSRVERPASSQRSGPFSLQRPARVRPPIFKTGRTLAASLHEPAPDAALDEELRQLFATYDVQNLGYIDRNAFKKVYVSMEQFGVEPSKLEIERLFSRYSNGSDKICFDEFCVLMLQRARL